MNRRKHKLVVEYGKNGYTCSDFNLEKGINEWIKNENLSYILVSTESIIQQFRVAVVEKKIHNEDITFKFEDEIIDIDENGHLEYWPERFCEVFDNQLDTILGL